MGDSTATTGSQTANLPIIDFSKIEGLNSEATENAAEKQKLFQALRNVGFIYLKNYGISDSKVQLLFDYATRFFSQPLSEKEKIESGESKFFRGWFSPERTSGDARIADQKEAFDIGDDGNPSRPNQWPADWPEFRTDMNYFFEKCHDIHLVLLSTLAETVGLSRDSFLPYVQDKDHFFRLLHYPQTTLESFGSRLRASPHTDYGTFTLLFNDNSGGLQIRGKDGQWLDVHPIPGCAIVNIGDLLSRWFNGILQSTEHRVIEPSASRATLALGETIPSRYALAWFGNPNRNAYIEPFSACITEDNPKRFDGVYAGKHVADRIAKLHKDGKAPEVWKDSMYRKDLSGKA